MNFKSNKSKNKLIPEMWMDCADINIELIVFIDMKPVMVCHGQRKPNLRTQELNKKLSQSVEQLLGSLLMVYNIHWTTLLMRTVSSHKAIICQRFKCCGIIRINQKSPKHYKRKFFYLMKVMALQCVDWYELNNL